MTPATTPKTIRGRLRVGVLISGRGSNLKALLDAAADPTYPAEVALVIADTPEAGGLRHAEAAGVPIRIVARTEHPTRAAFDAALHAALTAGGCGLVCLAGFMRLLGAEFVERWRDRLINIHPSLLPAFKGLHAQAQAVAAGVRIAGCTVHFVRPAMDAGPIIAQAAVAVKPDDDADALAARVLAQEHRLYPAVVRWIAEGRVRVDGDRAIVEGGSTEMGALVSPAAAGPAG